MVTESTFTKNSEPKKDNMGQILIITIAIIIGAALLGIWISPEPLDNNPKVGDVWEFYGTGDPFKSDEIYRRRIIGIEDNYIQFIENRRDTLTRTLPVFVYNSKLVDRSGIPELIPMVKDTVPIVKFK